MPQHVAAGQALRLQPHGGPVGAQPDPFRLHFGPARRDAYRVIYRIDETNGSSTSYVSTTGLMFTGRDDPQAASLHVVLHTGLREFRRVTALLVPG